jgi:PKD repeat protein
VPVVTRISPAHGPAKGETAVTITGTGFAAGDTVAFGRNAATSVTVVSATRILAKAPAGAGTVAVTVTNVDGPSRATAASAYAYVGKPVFSSAAARTVTRGKAFSFTAVAGGYPAPALTVSGHLPPGVTFTARKGGTATLAAKPTRAGKYTVTLRARNANGTVTKTLTITVRA